MDVVLVTNGSRGDIHPFICLGIALKNRGYQVTVVSIEPYKKLCVEADLNFISCGDGADYYKLIHHPDVYTLNIKKSFDVVAKYILLSPLRSVFDILKSFNPANTIVLGLNTMLGARLAQEKFGLPFITVCLHPFSIWSAEEPCVIDHKFVLKKLPFFLRKSILYILDRFFIDRALKEPVNYFRNQLGLNNIKNICSRWIYSPQEVLCLFPSWMASPAPDWPINTKLMNFLHYDEHPDEPLPTEVIDFLSVGEKPILITYSTAITQASAFFEYAIEAIRLLGLRCLVLTPHQGNLVKKLRPSSELYVPYVPHKKLLPHCAAIIHSGAVGTSVLALSFELPQLLVPFFYDQFDNSDRLKKMGVALTIAFKNWNTKRAVEALQHLLYSKDIRLSCKAYAKKIDFHKAEQEICDHIENILSDIKPKSLGEIS